MVGMVPVRRRVPYQCLKGARILDNLGAELAGSTAVRVEARAVARAVPAVVVGDIHFPRALLVEQSLCFGLLAA